MKENHLEEGLDVNPATLFDVLGASQPSTPTASFTPLRERQPTRFKGELQPNASCLAS